MKGFLKRLGMENPDQDRTESGRIVVQPPFSFLNLSLRAKFIMISALIVGTISTFVYLYFPYTYRRSAIESAREQATRIAEMTAFWSIPAIQFGDSEALNELVSAATNSDDIDYLIITNPGGMVLTEHNPAKVKPDEWSRASPMGALAENPRIDMVRPIEHAGSVLGSVYLGLSLESVNAEIARTRRGVAIVSVILFFSSGILFLMLSTAIMRPLSRMVEEFDQIASGDLSRRIKTDSFDEIGRMTESFNLMVDDLQQAYQSLEESKLHLEERVAARTDQLQNEVEERKRVEEELRTSQHKLMSVFELTSDVIFIKDELGRYRFINPAGAQLFPPDEKVIGKTDTELFGKEVGERVFTKDQEVLESNRPLTYEDAIPVLGEERIFETNKVPLVRSPNSAGIIGISRDVTEKRHREIEIERSLHEKEALLKEIHHRVKNNLQVIASLLNLQSRGLSEGPGLKALNESRNRVYTMALVHELLYRSDDFSGIPLQNYLEQLGQHLLRSYGLSAGLIDLEVDARSVELDIDIALPLALIVNELISNSLKYAFPTGGRGSIVLSATRIDDTICELIVRDSGVGLPDDYRERSKGRMGLGLVQDLVSQVNASIAFDSSAGTSVTIRFPAVQNVN